MDVRQVQLNQWCVEQLQRIQDRNRVKRKAGRVDDHGSALLEGLLNPVDHHAFVVGLAKVDDQIKLFGQPLTALADLFERGVAIDVRLTTTQQIEVRAVEDEDGAVHGRPAGLFGKNR
ncbi:hypothetical protein D9M71_805910 [compost metagenome]